MTLDYASNRRLALVKQVYSNAALQAANRYSAGARLLAVIGFDWAAEGMIKAVLTCFKVRPASLTSPFSQLIADADTQLQNAGFGKLPDSSRAEHIRKVRNAAQHDGRVPTEQEVVESQVHAADFLEAVCRHVWNTSFQSVSMANLVKSAAIRALLLQGGDDAEHGNYRAAIAAFGEAAAKAVLVPQALLLGPQIDRYDAVMRSSRRFDPHDDSSALYYLYSDDQTPQALSMMQTTMLLSLLGSSLRDKTFFDSLTGHVAIMADGSASITNPKADPTESDAAFANQYAVNLAIRVEEYFGDMLERRSDT